MLIEINEYMISSEILFKGYRHTDRYFLIDY